MSGEKAIGVAILGCGKMGQNVLSTLQNSPRVRAITVFDRNPGRMEELKTKFGVKSASTLDDVLKDPAIKLVLVTASNNAHRELTVAALEAGKAVMCEKPIVGSYLREIGTHLTYCDHDCYADHCISAVRLIENRAKAS